MALPRQLLIAVSLLNAQDKGKLDAFGRLDPLLLDPNRLAQAIENAVDDRIAFAKEFLVFAKQLLNLSGSPQDMFARNALARTYYSAHHGIRACLLSLGGDQYDHREAIQDFGTALNEHKFLAEKLKNLHGLGTSPAKVRSELINLLEMRHDADYHGYGSKEPSKSALNFQLEAQGAIRWVTELIEKIETYVIERRAGIIP